MLSAGWDSSLSSNIPANFPIPCPVCGFKHRCTNYKQAIAIKLSSSKYLELNINRIICITHGNQKFHRCWKCWQDNERQTVFTVKYNTESLFPIIEVIMNLKIPQSVTSGGATKSGLSFIKATQIEGLKHGQTIDFGITGDVEVSGGQPRPDGTPTNQLYSVPVKGRYGKTDLLGQYSLNKTALKILVDRLGDETEEWVGATFTSMALPTRNPQTNAQTTTLSILAESVKGAKSK